uniref:Uncharacterized protein n=1 Tax=Eutreptiella gymnastica TaxID=73025 RepID=A0A7S4CBR0_9EUGL
MSPGFNSLAIAVQVHTQTPESAPKAQTPIPSPFASTKKQVTQTHKHMALNTSCTAQQSTSLCGAPPLPLAQTTAKHRKGWIQTFVHDLMARLGALVPHAIPRDTMFNGANECHSEIANQVSPQQIHPFFANTKNGTAE